MPTSSRWCRISPNNVSLEEIPGVGVYTARTLIAEIGVDMNVFQDDTALRHGPASAPATMRARAAAERPDAKGRRLPP